MRISDWSSDVCSSDLGGRLYPADEAILPQPVHTPRHGVVHQIIAAGDAGEDAADAGGLLLGGYVGVAEGHGLGHVRRVAKACGGSKRILAGLLDRKSTSLNPSH